ncbi:adipolin-like [Centruroides sculpturatus]|uniref:adipolin-like n=1 Tax=Centruroides sculpturatus TaxID=218467 RepID=UPI000C6C959B|nr:adipolin-like [Centruroides sculpturatus]
METCTRVLLVLALVFVTVCAERIVTENDDKGVTKKPASRLVRPFVYNARDAWQTFLKNAEREEKKAKKQKNRLRNARIRQMQTGLPGPRGPRGPPGPPGGQVTKEELVKIFGEMVKDAAEKKFQITIDPQCTKEYSEVQKTKSGGQQLQPPLFDVDHVTITPKVSWSFLWQLKENVWIGSNTINEISNYYKPIAKGSHDRCQSFVSAEESFNCQNNSWLDTGRYELQKSGFYTFYVSFHFNKNNSCEIRPFDSIEVLLCINSQCEENVSLKTITDVKNSPFTVSINGILHLKKKQYVSIYVNNNSKCSVKIFRNSQVTGFLTGY